VAANDPNNGIERGVSGDDTARAATAMDQARKQVERRFESSPEWIEASMAFDEAKAANDRARARVVANLKNDLRYQSALRESAEANKALEAARAGGAQPGDDSMQRLSATAMHARSAVAQTEANACAADPAAAATAAKLKEATTVVAQLRQQEQAAVLADAAWQAAQQDYQRSMGRLASARATPSERMR
jgi:hypothetical protein